ncbi:histidine kinase [Kribbella sp. NBC_01505]|uniref:sensor histidine kinase n=1 Tax=Kribbella sp. NBC_01505 TaxID=2903580 RepID=UPI00386D6BB8
MRLQIARWVDTAAGRAARDVTLWLVLLTPSVVWAVDGRLAVLNWWELLGPPIALAAVVLMNRRFPLVSFALSVALTVLDPLSPVDRYTFAVVVVSYLLAVRAPSTRPVLVAMAIIVLAAMLGGFVLHFREAAWVWGYTAVALPVVSLVPWLVGRYRRQQHDLAFGGWARAEEMEQAQQADLRQARLRERARIAHDMHDSLGHELSLLTLRAGELELSSDLAEHHRDAVGGLRMAAGTATERLREIIGVLRDDSEPAPSEPAQDSVGNLVERARSSGLRVRLETEGEAAELPPMADRAAYRVVQESLTNAAKHAPGAAVTVRLTYQRAETVVTVTNKLPPKPVTGVSTGNLGLVGLQERVRLAGGTFEAGPRGGIFTTVARLPHAAGVADRTATGAESPAATLSMAARQRDRAQRRARRGFLLAFAVPAAFGLFMLLAATGIVYQTYSSVLSPEDYARVQIGLPEAEVRPYLPVHSYSDLPEQLRRLPAPAGARCEYYVPDADLLATAAPIYRLCFSGGRLVAKDELTRP